MKPSDINNKKENKLTRRRVMKSAVAAGFSTATALALTPEDVKASDSDQVTIAWDVKGEEKRQVPADWYDHLSRAREVTKRIQERFNHKRGVLGIGLDPGKGEDNPHVVVDLYKNHPQSEERRGEIPERERNVRIDVEEKENEDEVQCENPQQAIGSLPGSVTALAATNGPRVIEYGNNYLSGWSVAAHSLIECDRTGQDVTHQGATFGTTKVADPYRDWAFVEQIDVSEPAPEVMHPDDRNTTRDIIATVSQDGMADLRNQHSGGNVEIWGTSSCSVNGSIYRMDYNTEVNDDASCGNMNYDQVQVETGFFESTEAGDSGALYQVENPDVPGDWYAIGSHSFRRSTATSNFAIGPQGYTIENVHSLAWDQS